MVRGLDTFREYFRDEQDQYLLIGGVACHEWLGTKELPFRLTEDIDMVLVVETLSGSFVRKLRAFIKLAGYTNREKSTNRPIFYRFSEPNSGEYPKLIEVFSRSPDGFQLDIDQAAIPIKLTDPHSSLSAILMDEHYYELVKKCRIVINNLPIVSVDGLIPLKAKAWLDLTDRHAAGEAIDSKKIKKHRNDVFRLAAALPDEPGPVLPDSIQRDLLSFMEKFPANSGDWIAIRESLKAQLGAAVPKGEALIEALRAYFHLSEKSGDVEVD